MAADGFALLESERIGPDRPGPARTGPLPGFDWLRPIKSKLEGNRSLQKNL